MDQRQVQVYDLSGDPTNNLITLPLVFSTPLRPNIIKRAVLASRSNKRQKYGRDPMAGKRTTAESWGPGHALARVPRVKGRRHRAGGMGAFAPFVVGGRVTHPPRAERNFAEKINKKERRLAIRSAIAATANSVLVEARGHIIDELPDIPLIISDKITSAFQTAKEARSLFQELGLWADIEKIKRRRKTIRPGKGKRRGRRTKKGKSVLIVLPKNAKPLRGFNSFPGVDVVPVDQLNAEYLAPGTHPGRLTLWTESAIKDLEKGLFE
ncbi:MAG: 50S ribosomal protein L4 [Candidatus Hodarchaeota archaeon]